MRIGVATAAGSRKIELSPAKALKTFLYFQPHTIPLASFTKQQFRGPFGKNFDAEAPALNFLLGA